ncbi:hypothetical protein [Roseibium sp. Sym1]|uniref:hypothetical protein n=1 Tax=Roseibium sp. Sym1 TaxID=3016006 RepID=UPI0022B44ADA|nr:hypothetical protein [Roseibium sp. Sym1]
MKPFLTLIFLAASSLPAFAHAGAHDDLGGIASAMAHLLGSPFHVALVLAGLGAAVAAGLVLRRSRATASRTPGD